MSADDRIRLAYEQGYVAGDRDCPRSKCPYAPHTQQEKWLAWMAGYAESAPRYFIAKDAA